MRRGVLGFAGSEHVEGDVLDDGEVEGRVSVRTRLVVAEDHVEHPVEYCVTVAGAATNNSAPIVTVEWGASLGVALFALWDQAEVFCFGTPANVFEVQTYKANAGESARRFRPQSCQVQWRLCPCFPEGEGIQPPVTGASLTD